MLIMNENQPVLEVLKSSMVAIAPVVKELVTTGTG
jgi:hypothetical protein